MSDSSVSYPIKLRLMSEPGKGRAGDKWPFRVKMTSGTYLPVVIDVNNITIEKVTENANPVVDATGEMNGDVLNADEVTINGIEVV